MPGACKRTPVSCNEEALHYGVYERPSVDFSMLNQIVQSLVSQVSLISDE